MSRAPILVTGGRPTSHGEFLIGRQLIGRSGILEVLEPALVAEVGRPRELSLEAFLVVLQLNAMHPHHQAHLVEAARVFNALSDDQRLALGVRHFDPAETYPRIERMFVAVAKILASGSAGVDATWFANQLARAAIAKDALVSRSVAVDGTDVETWGRLQGSTVFVELDGEAADTQLIEEAAVAPRTKKGRVRTARVLAVGDDGRKQYTKDPDARAGHRSAKGNRSSGPYVGYELHLAVQTRDVRWTNSVD